jgi:hypothetical protein
MSPRNSFWVSNLTIKSKPKTEPGRQAQQTGDLRDKITDSVTYWNAYVAVTEMHGSGTFFDARLNNKDQYPVAPRRAVPATLVEHPT